MTFKLFKWNPAWLEHPDALKQTAPDWRTELQKAVVSKPAFVALTMGCKEDVVLKAPNIIGVTEAGNSAVKAEYDKRWGIIDNNLPDGPPSPIHRVPSINYCYLQEATQMVYDLGWKLPRPMHKLITLQLKGKKARVTKYPRSHPGWRKAFEYESVFLDGLNDLIERYFIDEEGKPITDPKKWPLKKNMESSILHGRLLDAADTLITSGQRRGNRKV